VLRGPGSTRDCRVSHCPPVVAGFVAERLRSADACVSHLDSDHLLETRRSSGLDGYRCLRALKVIRHWGDEFSIRPPLDRWSFHLHNAATIS
jgi:hypothetical protein